MIFRRALERPFRARNHFIGETQGDALGYRILPRWGADCPPQRGHPKVAKGNALDGKIDQLKAKAERGIELLKERRSALISAAVTGKIDVRNVVADPNRAT